MRDLLSELTDLFRDEFEDDELVIGRATTAADVPGWDSVQHVSLILRIEGHFRVRFSSAQVADMMSVGDLIDAIQAQRGPA